MTATLLAPTELSLPAVPLVQLGPLYARSPAAIAERLPADFTRLMGVMARADLVPAGAPRANWVVMHADGGVTFTVAVPVTEVREPASFDDPAIAMHESRAGRYLRFVHHGSYTALGETYEQVTDWLVAHGILHDAGDWPRCTPMWEEYVTDPLFTPASDLVTHILVPLRELDAA